MIAILMTRDNNINITNINDQVSSIPDSKLNFLYSLFHVTL